MSAAKAEILRIAERNGWSVERTPGGHFKLRHAQADRFVITSATPSDPRAIHNLRADMRRAVPVEVRQLPPRTKRKPKAPKPKRGPAGTFAVVATGVLAGAVDGRRAVITMQPKDGVEQWQFSWRQD